MKPKHSDPEDDAAVFRAAIGAVQPLPEQNRILPETVPRKPLRASVNKSVEIPDNLSDFISTPPPEEFIANGLSRMTLRKLRRGHWAIQDTLDLHGLHSDAARQLLQFFLHQAITRKYRCVLVIHGKGLNSVGGEAVLKVLTRHWLTQHPDVVAYCDAVPKDGGSGAALILLRVNS